MITEVLFAPVHGGGVTGIFEKTLICIVWQTPMGDSEFSIIELQKKKDKLSTFS